MKAQIPANAAGEGGAMLQSARNLQGFVIRATDGKIGHVEEFYFDDERWTIRYLVVNTGSWLLGRRVLISPVAVTGVSRQNHAVEVNLTRRQVELAPDVDTAQPISRRQETSYLSHFGWPIYWSGGTAWGDAAFPGLILAPPTGTSMSEGPPPEEPATEEDHCLHSTREVSGYAVMARDGEIGHVEDFLLEDQSWTIRYLAVDTRNYWPGNPVLVPPQWLTSVTWSAARVRLDHTRSEVEQAPEWDPGRPLTRKYESELHRHYQRPDYWSPSESGEDELLEQEEDYLEAGYVLPPA